MLYLCLPCAEKKLYLCQGRGKGEDIFPHDQKKKDVVGSSSDAGAGRDCTARWEKSALVIIWDPKKRRRPYLRRLPGGKEKVATRKEEEEKKKGDSPFPV